MSSAASIINQETSYTAQTKAAQPKVTGTAGATLTSSQFMDLMLKQIQFQDPMAPTDNAQMVTQQCQFSQLSATNELTDNTTKNNADSQAASLVGENVTITDPNDKTGTKTITGTVTSATINGTKSTIHINDKDYPISLLKSVNSPASAATTTNTTDITSLGNEILQDLKALPTQLAKELKSFLTNATPDTSSSST